MKHKLMALILAAIVVLAPVQQAHAIFGFSVVFDPRNFAQNILVASRTLQQINNQIAQLQNQSRMIINQTRHLTSLPTSIGSDLRHSLIQLDSLIRSARNVAYQIDVIQAHYQRLYPQEYAAATSNSQIVQDGQEAWTVARQGFQHSMQVQAKVIEQVRADSVVLDGLVSQSQGAVGSLQAAQAGNQLAAFNGKQMMQLQTLIAASARADALDRAAMLAAREQARVRFANFLGDRTAYTP